MHVSLSLPSDSTTHPVRYLYGTGVFPPSDPEQILTDRIEQWCAKQQAEHQSRDSRLVDLRVQTLQELDRAILALQLLTQSNWGPGQTYRFLNVRASVMEKDPVVFTSLEPTIQSLVSEVELKSEQSQASLLRSGTFAAVIAALRRRWSIEERDNRVVVDLLPLSFLVRPESPYFCSLTARLDQGVCVVVNADLAETLQHRKRLHITSRGFASSDAVLAAPSPSDLTGRAGQIDAVLSEFQDICLDHAIYSTLVEVATSYKQVDRSKWLASVRPGEFVQFVCLADPTNIRTIKVELVSARRVANSIEQGLRRVFIQNHTNLATYLLNLP